MANWVEWAEKSANISLGVGEYSHPAVEDILQTNLNSVGQCLIIATIGT